MKYVSVRLFSGTVDAGTQLIINDAKKGIRIGHPLKLQGTDSSEIDKGVAGDIITLAKIDDLKLGDMVHDGKMAGKFVGPAIPKPMFGLALEPAARGEENKISAALDKLTDEDPCFTVEHNQQTKELVISGLGDLHLRVMLSKMENRYKVHVNTKPPKIPYRETISGKGAKATTATKSSPAVPVSLVRCISVSNRWNATPIRHWNTVGTFLAGRFRAQFEPAILKGIHDIMDTGFLAGFPMQDIKVSVYDGKYHAVDSKEVAFRAAGKGAFLGMLWGKPNPFCWNRSSISRSRFRPKTWVTLPATWRPVAAALAVRT